MAAPVVVDDVLPVPLFARLAARFRRPNVEPFQKQSFWCELGAAPRLAVEQAVQRCAEFLPNREVLGCEWFVRIGRVSLGMQWHCDVDLQVLEREKRHVHPAFSAIVFLDSLGGPTLSVDQTRCSLDNTALPLSPVTGTAFMPVANRLVVLRGDRLHAVAALDGDDRRRTTFVMHWWPYRLPGPPAPSYDAALFDELGLVPDLPAAPSQPATGLALSDGDLAALRHRGVVPIWR